MNSEGIRSVENIWGCHFHMEVEEEEFPQALRIQEAFLAFLESENITPSSHGFFRPGYGGHTKHMWEVRLEEKDPLILEKLGIGSTWLALNRGKLGAYVHPLTHNPDQLDLLTEAKDHEEGTLEMGSVPPLNIDFFYHPPIDAILGGIKDTRTPNSLSFEEAKLLKERHLMKEFSWVNPRDALVDGFHIHMDHLPENQTTSLKVYEAFRQFLQSKNLKFSSERIYGPKENGPHIDGGWEIKFEYADPNVMKTIGIALGWLMLNRQKQSVFIHPVTWHEGDTIAEIKAHEDYGMVLGKPPRLDLNFF